MIESKQVTYLKYLLPFRNPYHSITDTELALCLSTYAITHSPYLFSHALDEIQRVGLTVVGEPPLFSLF